MSLLYEAATEVAPAQLQPVPWQGPGSSGSCCLAKAVSPALLTGTWGCSVGQRDKGLLLGQRPDTCPDYGARTLPAHQHKGHPRPRPRPWLQAGHSAHAAAKRLRALLPKQGQGRTLSPPKHFGHLLVAAQNSSFSPGKSKLPCSMSKAGLNTIALAHAHQQRGRQGTKGKTVPAEGASSVQPTGSREPSLLLSGG